MNTEKLSAAGKIGKLKLKNRMTVPAMFTCTAARNGDLTERFYRYYEERAKGGFALLVTEDFAVLPEGVASPCLAGMWRDEVITQHAELVKRVHAHDALIFAQLYHAGRQTVAAVIGTAPVAPTAIPDPAVRELPRALTIDEIHAVVQAFIDAARRAHRAGYDGVEIHAAHGYLINEFLSPFSNRRMDEYGGSPENRIRILLEIVRGIRQALPDDFAIGCKLSVEEFVEGGLTLTDSQWIAVRLEAAGVDVLTASCGVYKVPERIISPYYFPECVAAPLAAGLKQVVSIPVIAVNRIRTPEYAEMVLRKNQADFVAVGRGSIADPHWAEKVLRNQTDEIIPCIGCNQGCAGRVERGLHVACLVNPMTGREADLPLIADAGKRRIVVAGGGVAGMEAALLAAKRGFQVVLFERDKRLGGVWVQAAVPPCKEGFLSILNYLERELEKAGVDIRRGTPLTNEKLWAESPDLLICATGAEERRGTFPGIKRHPNVVTALDLLDGKCAYGKRVVILGGGMVGLETAEHLACHNSQLSVVVRSTAAKTMMPMIRHLLLEHLAEAHVGLYEGCDVAGIEKDAVWIKRRSTGQEILLEADQIVLALGAEPRQTVAEWANEGNLPYILIGDADEVGDGVKSFLDALEAVKSIQ